MNNRGFFKNNLVTAILVISFPIIALALSINITQASLSSYNTSTFAQYCASHTDICYKDDQNDSISGSISCPQTGQTITSVYVHAGDGNNVYEMPHVGFNVEYNNDHSSVTVTKTTHQHNLSWIAVVCGANTQTPTPVVTATPDPTTDPTADPTSTPVVTTTPSPNPTPICESECCGEECSTPTPTAQPTVDPTSSPNPSSSPWADAGKHSSLNKNGPSCDNKTFEVTFDLREDGRPVAGVEVTIDYRGDRRTHKTDNGGRVQVFYTYGGAGDVLASAQDNYPSQSLHIDDLNCPSGGIGGAVLSSSTSSGATDIKLASSSGKVLGSSTTSLGATGTVAQDMYRIVVGFAAGIAIYMALRFVHTKAIL